MKTTISTLATFAFITCTAFLGCQSPDDKVESAHNELQSATENLDKAEDNASNDKLMKAQAEEWKVLRADAEKKIAENELATVALREKLKKTGKNLTEEYTKKIEGFEEQNKLLKLKIEAYEKNQSEWVAFKQELSHDMDALGKALKDFTMDNKK